MKSSTTVACRAGVMLVCLIAIPLAALFGTKLPGLVQRWLDREKTSACGPGEDVPCFAPPFRGSGDTAFPNSGPYRSPWGGASAETAAGVEPGRSVEVSAPVDRTSDLPSSHYLRGRSGASHPGFVPVSVGPTGDGPVAIRPAVLESDGSPLVRVAPAEWRESSAQMDRVPTRLPDPRSDQGAAVPSFVETPESQEVQRQLREWGASYYALETWGAQGDFYRFQARMAAGGGAGYVRHFDAVDRDALGAMASVLDQVKRWRAEQERLGFAFPP